MQLGIRSKFIGILLIASVLPMIIAVVAVWVLGHYYYKRERGVLFQAAAKHLALDLSQAIQAQVSELNGWVQLSTLPELIREENGRQPDRSAAERSARIQEIQSRWPELTAAGAELNLVLTNRTARELDRFQSLHPLFAEILVTDRAGQVIGCTKKSSDYWWADEVWWQTAFALGPGQAHVAGINYDESARVYSIDVALPVFARDQPRQAPVGVIRGVLNATMMFKALQPILANPHPARQLVLGDGRVLLSLFDKGALPSDQHLPASVLQTLAAGQAGWMDGNFIDDAPRLVGYAPVRLGPTLTGLGPMDLIVHENLETVLAPVHRQLWILAGLGAGMLLLFAAAGLYIAQRKIIHPIWLLRTAAQTIAASDRHQPATAREVANHRQMLREIDGINTHDELESLALDFHAMAARLLSYHARLREEIADKTAEIQSDLQVAREFQEALMPRAYPAIPTPGEPDALCLAFHHIYKPTSSVGGDFFDVLKLSDHRAGIIIADVMGHGARAALVTAILRTLLQDLAGQADEPAAFLALLNAHFHGIVDKSSQFLFVSAFYMVIDTAKGQATYASAGHPPALLIDRESRTVSSLIPNLENNPALGLFPDSRYTRHTRSVKEGDLYLLYTDGVFEAVNPAGEEFGHQRLRDLVEKNLDQDGCALTESVIEGVNQFRLDEPLADDICLVACEIKAGTALEDPVLTAATSVK